MSDEPHPPVRQRATWLVPLAFALLLVGAVFGWHGRLGLRLADGGFLWYGAVRAALGEIPLRDFQSYDPGR